jgi:hypothetical protein
MSCENSGMWKDFLMIAAQIVTNRMDPFQNSGQETQIFRPQFLTVICILTFIASSFGLISAFSNYTAPEAQGKAVTEVMEAYMNQMQEQAQDDESAKLADKLADNMETFGNPDRIKKHATFRILGNLLTFFGAFLMFRLKRPGFWFYLLGSLAIIIGPIASYGSDNLLSTAVAFLLGFFALVMVILYGVNYKHLR